MKSSSILILLVVLVVYPQISETIYTPSLPDIAHVFGVTSAWTSLSLSVYFWGFALGVLFWGILCDAIGRRPCMLWGLGVYAFGSLLCAISPNIYLLIMARLIQAFGASTGSIITQTMLRDLYSGVQRSQIFAKITAVIALSPALGPLMGGYLDDWFGFRSNFVCLLGMGLILWVISSRILPETILSKRKPKQILLLWKQMLQDKHIVMSVLFIAVCNGIMFSYYAQAPFIFIEQLGFSAGQYGWLGILIALSMVGASWTSHRFRLEFLGKPTMCVASILILLSLCWGVHAIAFLIAISLMFLGIGWALPGTLSQALKSYQHVLGSAGALLSFMYYVLTGMMIEFVAWVVA